MIIRHEGVVKWYQFKTRLLSPLCVFFIQYIYLITYFLVQRAKLNPLFSLHNELPIKLLFFDMRKIFSGYFYLYLEINVLICYIWKNEILTFLLYRGQCEYELVLKTDLYTNRHTQWYYFRIQNAVPGLVYKFRIVNLLKRDSLYNYG